MGEYLRVTPTTERLDPSGMPQALESLHKLQTESAGLPDILNPFRNGGPPRFEFLALSDGPEEPVEFHYGADAHLDTLETRLRSIYPETFDIERVEVDVAARLIRPVRFSREEFIETYTAGHLQYEFGPDERCDLSDTGADRTTDEMNSHSDGGPSLDLDADHTIRIEDAALELAPAETLPDDEPLTTLPKPTVTPDGAVFARPTPDTVSPLGVRWQASATRKQDWMTPLAQFRPDDTEGDLTPVEQSGGVLAPLIDYMTAATAPIAFQVVFQRRPAWQADAELRKEDVLNGRDTLGQRIATWLSGDLEADSERRAGRELPDSVIERVEAIDAKNPQRSFTANIRAIGVPTTDDEHEQLDEHLQTLASVFDPLDGPYYEVESERLREAGFRTATKERNARRSLQRVLSREITTGRGTTRPEFVLSGRELANFLIIPSSDLLTVKGTRGTRAEQQSRNPLPPPNPDLIQQFQDGMAIGYALDENGEPRPNPIRIPPELLTTHYGRFASTGGGKSKAIINDALSLRETTGGPVVMVDPKGDGMCENYLRCHYNRFGGLDDVYQFRVPETIPAFSFFDIRPALEAGRNREDAIQDKVDHFHGILRMIMGREQYSQAFVANEILSYLIKALFDEEYGSDVFGLDDLFAAALRMQRDQMIPPVSADNRTIEESLTRHFAKDTHQFQVSMDAVGNRLDKLKEDAYLRRIFSHVPEENDAGEHIDNRFDFREFLDEDATILFDLGDIRPEAQRAITLLLLSNLWDAVQVRRRDGQTNYANLTNLIIEEAAPVASTNLVAEQLLPQGRSFGLSMGLVMQFPEQVQNRNKRAYDEVLNNIKTKLIGNISIKRNLAESLAHEDLSPTELRNRVNTLPNGEWIAQLPSPSFGETGPGPFSLQPLPIASGHPESDQPLTESQRDHFESVARPRMVERTRAQYGLAAGADSSTTPEEAGWGSTDSETPESSQGEVQAGSPTQSSFIDQPTTETESSQNIRAEATKASAGDAREGSTSFGPSTEAEEETAADRAAKPENGSTPIRQSDVTVPDAELEKYGLSRDDVRFLRRVLDVMNREDADYTLLDSMRPLRDEFETLDLQRLIDEGLVEEASACGRRYYTVLPAGRELLDENLQVGPGLGDVGEKTPHRVGVRLLELWLQQREDVRRVEPYHEHRHDTVFDVAGFDSDDTVVWVGEAELPSNNAHAPVNDYDKLCSVDADAIWAFNRRETAVEVLERLADADRLEASITGRDARSFATMRDAVAELDAAGMTTVRGFKNLDQEVTQ